MSFGEGHKIIPASNCCIQVNSVDSEKCQKASTYMYTKLHYKTSTTNKVAEHTQAFDNLQIFVPHVEMILILILLIYQ